MRDEEEKKTCKHKEKQTRLVLRFSPMTPPMAMNVVHAMSEMNFSGVKWGYMSIPELGSTSSPDRTRSAICGGSTMRSGDARRGRATRGGAMVYAEHPAHHTPSRSTRSPCTIGSNERELALCTSGARQLER